MDRDVTKKCPACSAQMTSKVNCDDEGMFESLCRIYMTVKCDGCNYFENELGRIGDLKREAWGAINGLQKKIDRLQSSIEQGWVEPNSDHWIKEWKAKQDNLRESVRQIEFKEQSMLAQYGNHIKHEKEGKK